MLNILVADSQDNSLEELISVLRQRDLVSIAVAQTGSQALEALSSHIFQVMITAERLPDITGLELIKKIVALNPMINCIAASGLAPDDFHEASEGLGVLMQLPLHPKEEQVAALLKKVQDIYILMAQE